MPFDGNNTAQMKKSQNRLMGYAFVIGYDDSCPELQKARLFWMPKWKRSQTAYEDSCPEMHKESFRLNGRNHRLAMVIPKMTKGRFF